MKKGDYNLSKEETVALKWVLTIENIMKRADEGGSSGGEGCRPQAITEAKAAAG